MNITAYFAQLGTPKTGLSPTINIRDISDGPLTDCAATGFHIISAQGGSTQNWTSESGSFDYNDSDGYSYKIYKVR